MCYCYFSCHFQTVCDGMTDFVCHLKRDKNAKDEKAEKDKIQKSEKQKFLHLAHLKQAEDL